MNTEFSPISVSTALSLLLHAAFAVAIVQTQDVMQATGMGVEIELVSSSYISHQLETELAANKAASSPQQNRLAELQERNTINTPGESIEARQDWLKEIPSKLSMADQKLVTESLQLLVSLYEERSLCLVICIQEASLLVDPPTKHLTKLMRKGPNGILGCRSDRWGCCWDHHSPARSGSPIEKLADRASKNAAR